jgi:DUF1680 family protein
MSAGDEISINLFGASTAEFRSKRAGAVRLEQITDYPFAGAIRIRVTCERAARFSLRMRIPSWAAAATIRINGAAADCAIVPGDYAVIDREWQTGDEIALDLPMSAQLHRRVHRNVQESRAPDGAPIRQEVLHYEYVAITRGPLVYATGLIDGFKTEESLRLPAGPSSAWLDVAASASAIEGPTILLKPGYRAPLAFAPYYRAGGRVDGAWRLTWMALAPQPAPTLD